MDQSEIITVGESVEALGYVSSVLASRADAWNGNAPDWFPQPSEWLALFQEGLRQVGEATDI